MDAYVLFTFETTHHALLAEESAMAAGLAVEVVPAPPAARVRCNLALGTSAADASEVERVLTAAGIPSSRYEPTRPR